MTNKNYKFMEKCAHNGVFINKDYLHHFTGIVEF